MRLRSLSPSALFLVASLGCEAPTASHAVDLRSEAAHASGDASAFAQSASVPTQSLAASVVPPSSATASASASVVDAGPARVETLAVPSHLPASLVRSRDGKPPRILFFPGICSNAGAYLHGFTEAAAAHGGALAIDGDKPCGASKDFHSISSDPAREEPRIEAALDAAGVPGDARSEMIHVGYSLGATLLENLVKKSPERYKHVVLIGSPKDPRKDRLEKATTVATMSCSLDVPHRMKSAVTMLTKAGVRAAYFEMPGCTHGNLADGDAVFGKVFEWVDARAAP